MGMTRGLLLSLCTVAVAVTLSGCGNQVRETLGLNRQAPDEFQVVSRPPLTLPPEYRLRPPEPGAPPRGMGTAQDMGRTALTGAQPAQQSTLFGQPVSSAPTATASRSNLSGGEQALLAAAGAQNVPADIRATVNRESSILADEGRPFTDRLVFWRDPEEPGTIVNPQAEAQRLRERQALGEPITEGETPTIERRQRGMFEGLFSR